MRKYLIIFVKAVVSLGLLVVALRLVDARAVWRLFGEAEPWPLMVAALLLVVAGFCGAAAWFCLLRARLPRLSFATVAAAHWSGMFFNTFLPSNVGGDVVRGIFIAREALPRGFIIASLLIDRLLGLLCLVVIGGIAFAVALGHPGLAIALAALTVVVLVATPPAARRALRRLAPSLARNDASRIVRALYPFLELAATPCRLWPLLLCAVVTQVLRIWQNVFVIRALALAVPEAAVWSVIPLFGVVSALPFTIGGLGIREYVAQALAAPTGLRAAHLIALSLAGHAMVVLTSLPGVAPFLLHRAARRPREQESDIE